MIVMIGDSSVGKTCLLRKFALANFQIGASNHIATVGVDFLSKTIPVLDTVVKL